MANPKRANKEPVKNNLSVSVPDKKDEKLNLDLEEYKLAIQVQQNFYDVATKSITIFIAISAFAIGFVFRESVSEQLKLIFSWFNLAMSLFGVLGFTGFYIISKRLARRLDRLSEKLRFALPHHHALKLWAYADPGKRSWCFRTLDRGIALSALGEVIINSVLLVSLNCQIICSCSRRGLTNAFSGARRASFV